MTAGDLPPETRYARIGDANVAYQVMGEGSPDLLHCFGLGSHVDLSWDLPGATELRRRMASSPGSSLLPSSRDSGTGQALAAEQGPPSVARTTARGR